MMKIWKRFWKLKVINYKMTFDKLVTIESYCGCTQCIEQKNDVIHSVSEHSRVQRIIKYEIKC